MTLTCIKWVLPVLCAALAVAPAAARASASDQDFVVAREAAQRGQWKTLEQMRPRFAGHLLEAYPSFWLLDGTIERADARDVEGFLGRYPTGPLAEALRRDWLKVLGAAGSWDLFRAEHPRLLVDDPEITCYSFQERLARGDPQAPPEARALFLEGTEVPAPCDPVFAALAAQGEVSQADVWVRLRRLLAGGKVRQAKLANALLEPAARIPEAALDRAAADPARFLAHFQAQRPDRGGREAAIFAIARLAARDRAEEAAERLEAIAPRLGDDGPYAWSQLAWQAAMNLDPRALEWYARAGDFPLTDAEAAWKARAALRADDWKQVLAAIDALSPRAAREPTWRYWRARALRATGDAKGSEALLRPLAALPTFYGVLAAEELGVPDAPRWDGFQPSAAQVEEVRAMPGIRRALELYRLGFDGEGLREWAWATRDLDDRRLLAAARIAAEADVPDRAIFAADRTMQLHDYSQRYPVPHRATLDTFTRQWDLDEAFVYAIIRQESRFLAQARSSAGAVGLMQLMPGTARWVARQISFHPFRAEMLMRPDVNIAMGTYYLRRVLDAVGDPILAAAAYNAGPRRAQRWCGAKPLEGAIYAETIPYPETRDYVKKVFINAWFYRHRLTGAEANLRQLLGVAPGRDAESVAANIP